MKKSINKRMSLLTGFMTFSLIMFASLMFGDTFAEIGNGIASMIDAPNLADGISITSHIGGSALMTAPMVLTLKGDPFEIIEDAKLKDMSEDDLGTYYKNLSDAQTEAIVNLNEKLKKDGENASEIVKQLNELKDTQFKTMETVMKNMGIEIEKMKMGESLIPATVTGTVNKWLGENADKIKEMKEAGSGFIELEVKVPAPITTVSASNPDGIPELIGVQVAPPTNVNLKDTIVEGLVTTINTNQAAFAYTDTLPKDGDFSFVAEGGTKPQLDFKIETRYAEPVKAAAYEILTTEAIQDIPQLQSIANDLLRKKHALKRQNGILFGDGIAPNPKGATEYGRLFVVGAMLNQVQSANIMDVINACVTDIYTTHNYVDEMPYLANLVLMNPIDFFLEFVSAKDGEGKPLFPTASLFNRVVIGGIVIIPFEDIAQDDLFVADMSKYNTTNYISYTVKIGWINDQLIKNQFTMVGESRFHAFVKKLDEQAFIFDKISTVKAAILKP